jgi:hypothetical protein
MKKSAKASRFLAALKSSKELTVDLLTKPAVASAFILLYIGLEFGEH